MPLDANIILGVRPPQQDQQDTLASLARVLQLKNAMQMAPLQLQEAQQKTQLTRMEVAEKQQAMQEQQGIKAAIMNTGGDVEKAIPDILKAAPKTGVQFLKFVGDQKEAEYKAQKEKYAALGEKLNAGSRMFQGVLEAKDPATAYQFAFNSAKANGIDVSDLSPQWNPGITPQQIQQKLAQGLTAKERIEQAQKDIENKQNQWKNAATVEAENARAYRDRTTGQKNEMEMAGTLPQKELADRNPTEASLAMQVAAGKAPNATPGQVAAGQAADAALKRLDQSKIASRPQINVNMTPEQANTTAGMIAAGKVDPQTTRTMLRRQPGLISQVLAVDPNFDEADLDKRYNTLKEFTNTSNTKAGGQALALNVLIHHADLYQQVGEALKNRTFVPGNAAYNAVASAFGSAPPQQANLVARFLAGETGKVATGGVPAEGEINGILKSLSSSASPEQIKGAGQKLLEIASGRAIPLMERVKDAKLDNVVHVIGPDAAAILQRRGMDPNTLRPATSGQGAANLPAAARAQLKEGQITTFGNGQKWTLKNGQPQQVSQ